MWTAIAVLAALLTAYLLRVCLRGAVAYVADDKYTLQAIEDQGRADYPGCCQGLMQCRSFCDCLSSSTPSLSWISARAAQLRRQEGCEHEKTVNFYPEMFPTYVQGVECVKCGAVSCNGGPWEAQN